MLLVSVLNNNDFIRQCSSLDPSPELYDGPVYTGSDPKLLAFTRDRIHFDFMNTLQRSSKPFLLF